MSKRFQGFLKRLLKIPEVVKQKVTDIDDQIEEFLCERERNLIALRVSRYLARIRRRNKERDILIIFDADVDQTRMNSLMEACLAANPKATPMVCLRDEGLDVLQSGNIAFDMVYAVLNIGENGHSSCLFSMSDDCDKEARESRGLHYILLDLIQANQGDSEVIVVCGSNHELCPVAEEIETSRKSFEV